MSPSVSKPHDHFVRRAMLHHRVARSFFQTYLPKPMLAAVDLDKLEVTQESFIDAKFREYISDMVFRVPSVTAKTYFYLLLEHKSNGLEELPAPLEMYRIQAMMHYRTVEGMKKYPLVFPMVLYHGEKPYRGPRRIRECIDAPTELIELAWRDSFQLVDLSAYGDEELKTNAWLTVFQLVVKHIRNPDIMSILEGLIPYLQEIERDTRGMDFLEAVFRYLFEASRVENFDELVKNTVKSLSKEAEAKAMTIAEQLRLEGKDEVALKLMRENLDLAFIAKVTDLPMGRLEELKNQVLADRKA